jgi:hypothetical protein
VGDKHIQLPESACIKEAVQPFSGIESSLFPPFFQSGGAPHFQNFLFYQFQGLDIV